MGGGLEADLSQGAVPALWGLPASSSGWAQLRRPVLQVADVRHVPDGTVLHPGPIRYRLLLSDGVHSQHASLAPTLDCLVSAGALRRGSVVRFLNFVHVPDPDHGRTIFIIRLEILQTECALIGSLKLYKQPRNSGVLSTSRSMSHGLRCDCKPWFRAIQMGPSCGSSPSGGDKLSVWKMVGQIKDENLGYSDKPDLITVKATISCVTELLCHVACPLMFNGKRCNARATGDVDGTWRCNRCGCCFSEPSKYWCFVRIQIQDHTGTASATAYEEAAEEILGCRAKDLYSMKYEEDDHVQLDDIIRCAVGKQYVFQLQVRLLSSGVKCMVLKAEKVNPSAECHRLLGQINTLVQEGSGSGSGSELHSPTMPTYTDSLDSRVCSSVRRSSNSISSGRRAILQLHKQQLRECAVSEKQLGGRVIAAVRPHMVLAAGCSAGTGTPLGVAVGASGRQTRHGDGDLTLTPYIKP